jgi:RimJ/RimL family protein N-acetyltransferase
LEVENMIAIQSAAAGHVSLAQLERSDGEALRRFFFRLSPATLYRRFHSPIVRPEQARPERLLDIDHHDREAVIAVVDGEIVGVARYARWPGTDKADLAVVVADEWQRQGLATRMLNGLADLAQCSGIEGFTASVQGDNQPALGLLRRFRPLERLSFAEGSCEMMLPVRASDVSR